MKDLAGNGGSLLNGAIGGLESLYMEIAEQDPTQSILRQIAAASKKARMLRDGLASEAAYGQAIRG